MRDKDLFCVANGSRGVSYVIKSTYFARLPVVNLSTINKHRSPGIEADLARSNEPFEQVRETLLDNDHCRENVAYALAAGAWRGG